MPRPHEKLESNQRWLKRLARRMARSPSSADDLVQETYLTALSKPAPDGPLRPWLFGVMRRLAWGEARAGQRRAHREECFQVTGPPAVEPDPLLAYGIDRARLRSVIDGLAEPFRSTVEQRFLEGLSCVEIARAAGVPAGTVRWRQSRALELLRAELERPRRRARGIVWLPVAAIETAVAAGRRVAFSGRARALALFGAALAAVVVALGGQDAPAGSGAAENQAGRSMAETMRRAAIRALAATEVANRAMLASATSGLVEGEEDAARRPARSRAGQLSPATLVAFAATAGAPGRDLYDCTDESGELHCWRDVVTGEQAGGPVCIILDRSLAVLGRERAGAPTTRSSHDALFLRAARLANLSLAADLGCALIGEQEEEHGREAGGGRLGGGIRPPSMGSRPGARVPEPSCRTETGESGQSCTTCIDERGAVTTCAPVDCQAATGGDGAPCTTCTDADGLVESDCEVEPDGCEVLGGLDLFANEVLPILTGEIDLNEPGESPNVGCSRPTCHGVPREDGFYIDPAGTASENLARVGCFVDLARPERSELLLCALNDEGCTTSHSSAVPFASADDRNYERILAFIKLSGS